MNIFIVYVKFIKNKRGDNLGYLEFKSKFINQFTQYESVKRKVTLLKSALERSVEQELILRDSDRLFQVRDIYNSEKLNVSYNSPYLMCKYSKEKKSLLVGIIGPAWSRGWKKISKDKFVADQIDSFFYFANQYVYRGYQINILGAIALTYGRSCDFRGNEFRECTLPFGNSEYLSFRKDIPIIHNKRNQLLSYYIDLINSFDPFVNRVLYYYIRSLSLLADGYDEESITADDNTVDVIFQAIKKQKKISTRSRADMYNIVQKEISLSSGTIKQLENLYQLRCGFSAHPAHSKWWDFSEIYDSDIDTIMYAVKSIVIKFLLFEKTNRKIEKNPSRLSDWFMDNCDIIYDVVWFHKLPILN